MAMKDYVFKKSYIDAPLMPFHTLRERFFDEQKEYGKQIMVGRARHMDGTLWREAVRLAEASGKDFDAKDNGDEWNRADAGATPLSADLERDGAAERSRGAKPGRDLERRAARPRQPSARARGCTRCRASGARCAAARAAAARRQDIVVHTVTLIS